MTGHYSRHGFSSLCPKFQLICISQMEKRAAFQSDINTVVSLLFEAKNAVLYLGGCTE